MNEYDPKEYGDLCAEFYDQIYPNLEIGLLDTLGELSGSGPALELGVATGRVSRPLGTRGCRVFGIESSRAMIDRCRELPGSNHVSLAQADFTRMPIAASSFRLIFTLQNTLSLLPSYSLLQRCFHGVSDALAVNGYFLCETYYISSSSGPVNSQHMFMTDKGIRSYSVTLLDTSPDDLEVLAAEAGLTLLARWRDWLKHRSIDEYGRVILLFQRRP